MIHFLNLTTLFNGEGGLKEGEEMNL